MSRQLKDLVNRIFDNAYLQIDRGQYKKALENLEKAEELSEKANRPDFLCQALMLKGRALLALGRQEEALDEFQMMMEISVPFLLEDIENTDFQYLVYNSLGFTVKTLEEIDNIPKTKELLNRNEKYFDEIFAAYEGLLAKEPNNFEYIRNYLKTLENVMAYHIEAQRFEKRIHFMGRILPNYGKAFKIKFDEEELFDKLDILIIDFKKYCLIFKKLGEAKEVFEQVEQVYRKVLEEEPGNRLALEGLLFLYEESGGLYAKLGDIGKAEETFLRALEILEGKLRKQPGELSDLREQVEIFQTLGRAFYEEDETEKADQYAEKALEILKELPGKKPEDLNYQYEISEDFNELGELFGDLGNIEHAKECYLKEIEIYRNIHEKDPEDLLSIENVAAAFDQIGHLYARRKETEPAKYYYEQGIEIYEKLLESDPGNIYNEIDLADSFNYIGELYKFLEPEIARNYFEKALDINEKAVKLFPESTKYKEDLIYTLKNLASLNIWQGQDESAIPLHERITELSLEMVMENPGESEYGKALGVSHSELGLLLERAGKPELAKQQYSKAVEAFSEILQNEEEDLLTKHLLAVELQMQIAFFTHAKKYYIAKEYLDLTRDYYECLYENDPENPRNLRGLFEIRLLDGILQESMKNYGMAAERYESIFQILKKHLESDPENLEYQARVNIAYTQLGNVYLLADECEKSRDAFEKALPISSKLLEKDSENPIYIDDVVATFEGYAKFLEKLDRNEEAEEYSAKAEALKEKLKEKRKEEVQ